MCLALSALSVRADETPPQDYPKLITYQQLMQLSPAKRRAYIESVRSILGDFELHMDDKTQPESAAQMESFKMELQSLHKLETESHSTNSPGETTANPKQQHAQPIKRLVVPYWQEGSFFSSGKWSCDGLSSDKLIFNASVGTCTKPNYTADMCSQGYHAAYVKVNLASGPGVHEYCVPKDSWNALNDARKESLSQSSGASGDVVDIYSKKSSAGVIMANLSEEDRQAALSGEKTPLPSQIESAVHANKLPATDDLSSVPPDLSPSSVHGKDGGAAVSGKCKPKLTCPDLTSRQRRQLRSKLKGDVCIAGGNFSRYRGGHVRAGNCQTIRNWPDNRNKKLSCTQPNTAMCNPLLYCADANKHPFCFVPTRSFTHDCSIAAANVKCDPAEVQVLGLQDEWDKMRTDLAKMVGTHCLAPTDAKKDSVGKKAFREFFCNECQDIIKRLYAANVSVTGEGCGDNGSAPAPGGSATPGHSNGIKNPPIPTPRPSRLESPATAAGSAK